MPYQEIQRRGRTYYQQSDKAAYRVRATVYPSGRTFKAIVPANSDAEAESAMRSYLKARGYDRLASQGYNFQTRRVANNYRERE